MTTKLKNKAARRWKDDPVAFIEQTMIDPDTDEPFKLYAEQIAFLRAALSLNAAGRLPYPEMVFSAPKKSGKTGVAAMIAIYVAMVLAGNYGEIYCLANDYEQSQGRVFTACAKIIEASPLLRDSATITQNKITFKSTGTFIQACASDYSGFAGGNPTLTICDELWGFVHEASRRLFAEAIPSPARKVSGRLTVSYAGFEGESTLLEDLYKRGIAGELIGTDLSAGNGCLMYWTHEMRAPWQTEVWREQQRASLPTNQFLRMIENRWVSTESSFVDPAWWQACRDQNLRPLIVAPHLPIWVGVDASVKRDSTAVVAVTCDCSTKRARLIFHRIFQPSATAPLDFEATIEKTILELKQRFKLRAAYYDPYQMAASAARLKARGVKMVEFPQTAGNLTEASTTLFNFIKDRNLAVYPSEEIDLAISRAVALEIPARGWKISKEKASHKIDVVVAMAQALYAAISDQQIDVTRLAQALFGQLRPETDDAIVDINKTPEYLAMQKEQERPCDRCGLAVGPSYIPVSLDKVIHAGACPVVEPPKEKDSFGEEVQPTKPSMIDVLRASVPVPRGRAG
ncbi:MAG: terminase large subunit [Methylocella sp.]